MKKTMLLLLALCLVMAIGATAFATNPVPTNWTYGHGPLMKTLEGNFAYVNPFALVEFGKIKKAILEGDGGLAAFYAGKPEGSIYATGSVPVTLYCNCPVKMTATVKGGAFNWEFNGTTVSNHPNPNGQNNYPYKAMPVDLSWDGGTNWVVGQNNKDTTLTSAKAYDAWTYYETLTYKVHVPQDYPVYDPKSIDELHAGNYKGSIVFTITQDTTTKEGAFIEDHNGATCPDGY